MLELTLGLLCLASYPDAYMYPKENTAICLGNCESCHDYVERHPEYLNHCDVSPVRIGAFLSLPHICRLGPELVAFSLDFHVFGLSTFAGGRKHVVESGLPLAEKIVEFVETACTTMQNHSIKLFRAGLTFLASDASPTRGQLKNVSFAPPHLGDVDESGGRLIDIYDLHLSEARRGSSSPCGNHSTEYDEFVAEALHVSRVARLFMDHARTAIAVKMLTRELLTAGLDLKPQTLPRLNWHPEVYGRHWDVLLGLLNEKNLLTIFCSFM